jgi:hypothetical protein
LNYAEQGVLEISDKSGNSLRLSVDESTTLPLGTSYTGPQGPMQEDWSDLRDVDGMKVPFKIILRQGDRKIAEITVQDVKVNTGATADQLSKRP